MSEARDSQGRFLPGCPAGPGAPRASHAARVFKEAVGDDALRTAAQKLVELAHGGDVGALRVLLDRCIGRVREEPAEDGPDGQPGVPLALGDLGTAQGCADAMRTVLHAMTAGTLDPAQAAGLLGMLDTVGRAIERGTFEARLLALESRGEDR